MDRECLEEDVTICVADDLVSLAQLTDHSILNCLRERFRDDQIYVSLNWLVGGTNSLIAYRSILDIMSYIVTYYNITKRKGRLWC